MRACSNIYFCHSESPAPSWFENTGWARCLSEARWGRVRPERDSEDGIYKLAYIGCDLNTRAKAQKIIILLHANSTSISVAHQLILHHGYRQGLWFVAAARPGGCSGPRPDRSDRLLSKPGKRSLLIGTSIGPMTKLLLTRRISMEESLSSIGMSQTGEISLSERATRRVSIREFPFQLIDGLPFIVMSRRSFLKFWPFLSFLGSLMQMATKSLQEIQLFWNI